MTTNTRLTTVERARRKKIRALIRDGKGAAKIYCKQHRIHVASLLDDPAGVAEQYLKGLE